MRADNPTITYEDLLSHAAWLKRLAARLVESSAAAEDLVQDTFVAALRSPPEGDRSPRPWLAQVLRNLVRNRARGAGRLAARVRRLASSSETALPSAEELLTQHEARRLVADLVSRLEEPYRSTVLLCYGQGLSPVEVARKQEIPAGTVRWRLKRGLDDLRAALDQRYGGDRRAWSVALGPLAAGAAGLGAGVPVAGGMKLAASVAAAAAAGLWVGSWSATRPAGRGDTVPVEGAVEGSPSAAGAPGTPRLLPGGDDPGAGGPRRGPETLLAAAAPGGPGGPAGAGERGRAGAALPEEMVQRIMRVGSAPVKGDSRAPVTIVSFSEFQCPYCARVQPTLKQLLATYPGQVRLVWKNLPLAFHEHAKLAAEAALAANEQGKFWEMHDRLFANQNALDVKALEEHAQALGLDVQRFRKALEDKRFLAAVEEDMKLAQEANIDGTPSFYINGVALVGAQPLSAFTGAVDDALARAKGLPVPERPTGPPVPGRPLEAGPLAPTPQALAKAAEPGGAPSRGDPRAPVTIVVFSEFQCPYCARLSPVLDQVMAAYPADVRLVFRNLPLAVHANARIAAEAALAAHEQGKFWAMHDRLFANQNALDPTALEGHAREVGLDLTRFRQAMEERRFRKVVDDDLAVAAAAGIRGTPAALVNGHLMSGALPIENWKNAVDRALARARGLPLPPELPVPVAPGRPLEGARRVDVTAMDWLPERVALPDELLGQRLRVPFPTGDAPTTGPARAPVEVLYFNDYDCVGCGRGKSLVDGLRAAYGKNLRLIARPVPLLQPQPNGNSQLVAEAAWAAHAQGKFWEMHDKLFSDNAQRSRATLERYAAEIGLDVEEFRTALDDGRYRAKVTEDVELFKQAGLRERPLFVVDGRRADGPVALVQLVDAGLKKAGLKPPPLGPANPGRILGPDGRSRAMLMGLSTPQRFHLEPRDDGWAAAVEKEAAVVVERDLRALDQDMSVVLECKRSLCRVRLRSARSAPAGAAFLKQVYGAELRSTITGPEAHGYLRLRDGPDPGTATATESIARLRSRRTGMLFSLRTGRTKPEADLPLARLPRE
jgi:RNA polymerase sigma factor (sigma-70 family)